MRMFRLVKLSASGTFFAYFDLKLRHFYMSDNIYAIHISVSSFEADCHVESVSCHICIPSRSDMIKIST
jgi:hypothetical protein